MKFNKKGSVLLVAGTLFLAACSSGGSSTPTTSAPEPGPTQATSEAPAPAPAEPIRVALLTPGTANDGSWGQAVTEGTRAAVDAIRR